MQGGAKKVSPAEKKHEHEQPSANVVCLVVNWCGCHESGLTRSRREIEMQEKYVRKYVQWASNGCCWPRTADRVGLIIASGTHTT